MESEPQGVTQVGPTPGKAVGRRTTRWLTSPFFWPAYCVIVTLIVLFRPPWYEWQHLETVEQPVSVEVLRDARSLTDYGVAGTFVLVAEPATDISKGWIPCDGRELSSDEYPSLFRAMVGRAAGDAEKPQMFRVPDLSGLSAEVPSWIGRWTTVSSLSFRRAGDEEDRPREGRTRTRVVCFVKAE